MSFGKTAMKAFRGEIIHFLEDPNECQIEDAYEYYSDGLLVVEDGLIKELGPAEDLLAKLSGDVTVTHYKDGLIMPGFIDCHVHYPQTEMIASYGEQLLGWLEAYAFPTEEKFHDLDYAREQADFFLDQLMSNGTTTALVFGTVHTQSIEAFFEQAEKNNLRMICGKVLMDRNAPAALLDTAKEGVEESRALIKKWHGKDRLQYAITPRFAPTSSSEQLTLAGELLAEHPDVYMHTHLAENVDEISWVKELFPETKHYLDVYEQFGLLGPKSVFAHCIHLSDDELKLMSERKSNMAHCPTSNLFIGSGLFKLTKAEEFDIEVGLGTDVGGGTSFSILQTMNEAYKVQQLLNNAMPSLKSFFLATLGGARALQLQDKIGNFEVGKEADFIVLDYKSTPLVEKRMGHCRDIFEKLFVFSILGDDRSIKATHILGDQIYPKNEIA